MEIQLINQIKLAKYYSLQLYESTDISNKAILMMYVHYEYEGELKEEFFFFAALPQRTSGLEISKTIINYFESNGLDIKNCMGVCSDGAAAMIAEKSVYKGFCFRMCFDSLLFSQGKSWNQKIVNQVNVLCEVVKIVSHIKGSSLNSR